MTAARIARRKAARLAHRPSARNVPACVVAPHPWLSAHAKLPSNAFSARPAVSGRPQEAGHACSGRSILNRHDPCDDQIPIEPAAPLVAPPPAISCLGAFRTPPVGARG